jgi:hypothetical protein
MIDPVREWETWQAWLGHEPKGQTIYAEVVEMLAFRKIWRGFVLIHNSAPEQARSNATFLWWFAGTMPEPWGRLSADRSTSGMMSFRSAG